MRVCHKTEEDLFRKKIEQWVEAGISAGAKDFDDLLSRLPRYLSYRNLSCTFGATCQKSSRFWYTSSAEARFFRPTSDESECVLQPPTTAPP